MTSNDDETGGCPGEGKKGPTQIEVTETVKEVLRPMELRTDVQTG